jgi:hypothetical protein
MGAIRTLSYDLPLLAVRSHEVFSVQQCWMHPLTQELAKPIEDLLVQYITISQMELTFSDAVDKTYAKVHAADRGLNEFATKVSKTVLVITADDRSNALYTLFFGKKPLSDFKRPILGGQLEAMRKWASSLEDSEHALLKALAPELPPLIAAADAALAARGVAEQQKKSFREVGERRKYIDDVNATRRLLWTELAKLPHTHPELPANFADGFFRRDLPAGNGVEEVTVESVQQEIEDLAKQIEAKQALLQSLQQKAEQEAFAEQALKAKEEKLLAIQKENAARLLEEEALRAEIETARAA